MTTFDKTDFLVNFEAPDNRVYSAYKLSRLASAGYGPVERLPYSVRILLEGCLRHFDGEQVRRRHIEALANYDGPEDQPNAEIPYFPGRVVLQDFTGVPAVVDLAALRSALDRRGEAPEKINPMIRSDLVIDHSVQVDAFKSASALQTNTRREFERNKERYQFLKWGRDAFDNFSVVPPGTGIIHQVNLEYFASGVLTEQREGKTVVYPDSLVGTDSHTTMINGLGVLGWGVGGIEAEACMLGQPIAMLVPEVVGCKLTGQLREGATATDMVLTITQLLREHGVVGKFVEFFGPGIDNLDVPDRATVANMAPEYGATTGFFPVDHKTLDYMYLTGRSKAQCRFVETYAKLNNFWHDPSEPIEYAETLSIDLGEIEPSVAGPTHPQDRIELGELHDDFHTHLTATFDKPEPSEPIEVQFDGETFELTDGDIAIAAITSCTNTSNPSVMVAAGLVAKKAREYGLEAKPWVKTSLAPGSRVVTEYLDKSGLLDELESVGFYTVGYGCTTCIGNSGPLPDPIRDAIHDRDLVAASILSGNRNFEGRVSPDTKANYLASPPLVVAYAIAGTVDIDIFEDPLAETADGDPVFLRDIWPTSTQIQQVVHSCVDRQQFVDKYAEVYDGPDEWKQLESPRGDVYQWDDDSTYIQEPPFFIDLPDRPAPIESVESARCLVKVGDQTTTDHISPAGVIPENSPAGRYLKKHGVSPGDFNSYGSRRGNDRVMTRGTFGNIRLDNDLAPKTKGGYTTYFGPARGADYKTPDELHYHSEVDPNRDEMCFIYDAAVEYMHHGVPLVVIAGDDYGMGSSRDWAAKGTRLLGVEVVLATSYERIHRSNLIGMGVLPLQFESGVRPESLGLTGKEIFNVELSDDLEPRQRVSVLAKDPESGEVTEFEALNRIDSPTEMAYYRHGGILEMVLRQLSTGG